MAWTADLTNDPDRDYALCIDLWDGDEHRARIERDSAGSLLLRTYGAASIPVAWLIRLLTQAEDDLVDSDGTG